MSDLQSIETVAGHYPDPFLGCRLADAGVLLQTTRPGPVPQLRVTLGFPALGYRDELKASLQSYLNAELPDVEVDIVVDWGIARQAVGSEGLSPQTEIRNIIAVASGKGGVGKSTVAVNLALALQAEGARVGLLDADIYGPSQPRMLGTNQRPESKDGRKMRPVMGHGLQAMSVGFLVDERQPVVWRGPMATQALLQMFTDTQWNDLDYLVVDLPPGTGDVQLSLVQRIPVSGAVIVTTPQDIALADARKGLEMFRKVSVPVLGVVENMSVHICSKCGHKEPIFGEGGGERLSAESGVALLGQLPLDMLIQQQADGGRPTVFAEPDSANGLLFRLMARRAAARLSREIERQEFPSVEVADD